MRTGKKLVFDLDETNVGKRSKFLARDLLVIETHEGFVEVF